MIDLSFLNSTSYDSLQPFVEAVINLAVSLSALLAVISLVVSGFKLMLSGGNEDKIKEAIKSLTFAILGLVLVFLAPTVIQFVLSKVVGV